MDDNSLPIPKRRKSKGTRGQPLIYDELKKPRSIALTNTAINIADQLCQEFDLLSRGNTIEVLLRASRTISRDTLCQAISQTFDSTGRERPRSKSDQ